MKKFTRWLIEIADDVLAYVLTVVGILFSNIVPMMKSNEPFALDIGAWRIAGSIIIAVLIVGKQEQLTPDEKGSTAKAREGRHKKFGSRMSNALAQGVMWSYIMNMAG